MRTNDIFTTTYSPGSDPLGSQAYLPVYRRSFPDFDIRPDKIMLMLLSIMGSCDEICKNKMKSDKDYLDYMKNHFEECAK